MYAQPVEGSRMTGTPPLTIGLPVFNAETYLPAALESILGQTFGDFVLVVSDNASTDGTEEIVRAHAQVDARVQYERSPENRGLVWNFNHVFDGCRTEFFRWAASDDVVASTCFERCVETLRAAPGDVVLAYPRTKLIGPLGEQLGEVDDGLDLRSAEAHRRLRRVVLNMVYGNVVFAVIRSDALRRTRGHGNYPSADRVLVAELALLGQFREIPEALFFRRRHETMSRTPEMSAAEYARRLDPANVREENELWRLFREHLAAIRHVPLTRGERLLADAALVAAWAQRHTQLRTRAQTLVRRFR
jgi:glycosyltransferase involved in cell wall biosynthesis